MSDKKIDTEILSLFNKYYAILKRDNPNNQSDALQTAARLAQTQILKESVRDVAIDLMSTIREFM